MDIERVVYVDTAEPKHIKSDLLFFTSTVKRFEPIKIIRKRLPVADLKFNSLGAERKTFTDFMGSIKDGRYFEQMFNMYKNFEFIYLLISGSPEDLRYEDNTKKILMSIADAEIRYGIRVRFCYTDEWLVYYFLGLCFKLRKKVKPKWEMKRAKPNTLQVALNMLSGVPKIGRKKSKSVLGYFETLKDVANASVEELKSCKGIGQKQATDIYTAFNTKYVKR